jgi:hypothetical protein
MKKYLLEALTQKYPNAEFNYEPETEQLTWLKNEVSESKLIELEEEYDAQEYARNRQSEYPTIEELTVALYDTDDKAALETKRAAIKTKWPKDNSGPV